MKKKYEPAEFHILEFGATDVLGESSNYTGFDKAEPDFFFVSPGGNNLG